MKTVVSVLLACFLTLTCRAQENAVPLFLKKVDVRELLGFYEILTKKPLFVALDVHGLVTIETPEPLPRAEAIELIRTTLLERYGVELRQTERGETLVAWSKDPKYPRNTDPPMTDAEREAERRDRGGNNTSSRRIRIIKPEPAK